MSFTPEERKLLLSAPRIGPRVVNQLEVAGLDSLAKLRAIGVDGVVQLICDRLACGAWMNRRSALRKVIGAADACVPAHRRL